MELRIGELSRRVGVTDQTVRYYERLGLIRRARAIGMSLEEIGRLLPVAARGECGPLRHEVLGLIDEKIAESRRQLDGLERFKSELLASDLEADSDCECSAFPESCGCLPAKQD